MTKKAAKQALINEVLALNPNMRQVATSAVWMGEPMVVSTQQGFRLVNMTVNLPKGATLKGDSIVRNNVIINVCRP